MVLSSDANENNFFGNFMVWLSALAFLLYAAGVLALHQDRTIDWGNETAAAVPAAISHLIYGTPVGAMDSNVRSTFWRIKGETSIDEAIRKVADGSVPKGILEPWAADGTGAGTTLFATFSMWLFGMYMSSFVYFFLGVVGISTTAFILRFRDARLFSVPLYFFVLSVMLLTPLCASPEVAREAPIGGNRYFSLAAILPTLHIWFEILERSPSQSHVIRYTLLFLQAVVLFAVLLVRSSALLLLLPIVGAIIWQLGNRRAIARIIAYAGCIAAAGLLWAYIVVMTMPAYAESGRVFGNFWHRAFVGFSFHPEWPFGNLTQVFDCTKHFPQGLAAGYDASGHCAWFSHPSGDNQSPAEAALTLYGREYERVLRNAFFTVVSNYPKQTLELFTVIKGKMVWNTMTAALDDLSKLRESAVFQSLFWIVGAQAAVFAAFVIGGLLRGALVGWWAIILPLLFVLSLVPLHVAWSNRATSSDAVFLFYVSIALLITFGLQTAILLIRQIYRRMIRATLGDFNC